MKLPLALGLDLIMKRPQSVRLMDLPWRRKGSRVASRNGKKGKGNSRSAAWRHAGLNQTNCRPRHCDFTHQKLQM